MDTAVRRSCTPAQGDLLWNVLSLFLLSQLEFVDFDLEHSERCEYDSLVVFGDAEAREEIGKLRKGLLPEKHHSPICVETLGISNTCTNTLIINRTAAPRRRCGSAVVLGRKIKGTRINN